MTRSFAMDKLQEFSSENQTLEEWLEVFEARAACVDITNNAKLIRWCISLVGSAGRKVLKSLPARSTWEEAKEALIRYLGEEDPQAAAWQKLKHYKGEGKMLGEIATEIEAIVKQITDDEGVRHKLSVEAFLETLSWSIAKEIKKRKPITLREALSDARLLKSIEEEEDHKKFKERLRKMDTDGEVAQEIQELSVRDPGSASASAKEEGTATRPLRRPSCWACGKKGHVMKDCRLWKGFLQQNGRIQSVNKQEGEKTQLN